ncbi:MAG: hypothetical protein C0394_06530 [Syntrophus sp. (in: bacteria)]|nr:hypothetical protein [Syntrophus sp. (in: bacteria)]
MKKFWIVLLALGLVAGFAMSASAQTSVKFSGSYYVSGIYVDNPQLSKSQTRLPAQAFYQNRLRIQTEFKVAEGLMLVTRFDALEKPWGYGQVGTADAWRWQSASLGNGVDSVNRPSGGTTSFASTTARTQENIEFERAYLDFTTKIGRFLVGYQNAVAWGTMFLDTHTTRPAITYMVPIGPLTILAKAEKTVEQNAGNGIMSDADNNVYNLAAIYKFGAGDAGLMFQFGDSKSTRSNTAISAASKVYALMPYAKMKFGPVYVETEAVYGFGDLVKFDNLAAARAVIPALTDVTAEAFGIYIGAKADIGAAYVGGVFAWMRGDDITTADKREGGMAAMFFAGQAWNPTLILWNDDMYGAQHRLASVGGLGPFFDNAWMYQIYAGFKPVKQADISLKLTYAYADQNVVAGQISKDYGTEVDITAKYKLFDNLEYMLGAAYLFTGDYFKGATAATQLDNNYMLFHKLTLSF